MCGKPETVTTHYLKLLPKGEFLTERGHYSDTCTTGEKHPVRGKLLDGGELQNEGNGKKWEERGRNGKIGVESGRKGVGKGQEITRE
jgi:hypothetical protein